MNEKIYNKLIPILILIQPLFDVITTVMLKLNYSLTLGIIIKAVLMILFVIYLIFFDKKNIKFNISFLVILSLFSVINVLNNIDIIKLAMIDYFNYMFKYIYFLILILYCLRWFKNGGNIKFYQYRIPLLIIATVFFLSIVTNTAIYSYDSIRRGVSGWFNSANEISALLCLLFPISLYNTFHNKESKKIDFILFLLCGIMLIIVGTKVGFLSYIITLLSYILYRIVFIKTKKIDYKFSVCMVLLILPFLFINEVPAIYNTKLKIDYLQVGEKVDENISDIVLSGRDDFKEMVIQSRNEFSYSDFLFGKSCLTDNNSILIVEQDFLDIYYMYGLVGLLLLFFTFAYALINPLKYFLLNFKKQIFDTKIICCIIVVLLVVSVAYISGHVLLSPSVSTYLGVTFIIFCSKCCETTKTNKQKMIIYMPKLSVGGMEKALVNLLNMSDFCKKCDIDLYLGYSVEKKYLESIPKEVNVNLICKGKWNLIGKLFSIIKMSFSYINLIINPYKYDVSICYAYQHGILSKLSRLSSKNNVIFVHNDLLKCRTPEQLKKLKRKVRFDKFAKVVCVSEGVKTSFSKIYPNYKGKVMTIYNYINGENVVNSSLEKVKDLKKSKKITFINIGRHEEKAKKISRIISSSKKLLSEGYDFRVVLIGDGQDHQEYVDLVKDNNLEKNIILLGKKVNPYPYLKLSDCFILSSEYEGYGIVLDESRILNVPIVSTEVADSKIIMNQGYGILCENSSNGVYIGMKTFLNEGYKITKKFDYNEYNKKITKNLNTFILGE